MPRIAHLLATSLSADEKAALRQCGLGRGVACAQMLQTLVSLRLVTMVQDTPKLTKLGKDVLGVIILDAGYAQIARDRCPQPGQRA